MRTATALALISAGAVACSATQASPPAAAAPARRQGAVSLEESRALVGTWTLSVDVRGRIRTTRMVIEKQDSLLVAVMDPPSGRGSEYETELMEPPTGGASGWQPQAFWVHGDLLRIQFRSLDGGYVILAVELGDLGVLRGRIGECEAPQINDARRQQEDRVQMNCYSGDFTARRLSGAAP